MSDFDSLRPPGDSPEIMTPRAWAARKDSGDDSADTGIVAAPLTIKEATQGEGRSFRFLATSAAEDRDQDVIEPEGGDLTAFRRNPIILPWHDHRALPIGLARQLDASTSGIEVEIEYAPKEVNPLAESFYQLHVWRRQKRALEDAGGAVSIGLGISEWARREGTEFGIHITTWELREISDVNVPAHPGALMRAASDGVAVDPLLEWATKLVRGHGKLYVADLKRAEIIAKALDPSKGLRLYEIDAGALAKVLADQDAAKLAAVAALPATCKTQEELENALKAASAELAAVKAGGLAPWESEGDTGERWSRYLEAARGADASALHGLAVAAGIGVEPKVERSLEPAQPTAVPMAPPAPPEPEEPVAVAVEPEEPAPPSEPVVETAPEPEPAEEVAAAPEEPAVADDELGDLTEDQIQRLADELLRDLSASYTAQTGAVL